MASLFRPTYTDKKTGKPRKTKKWYGQFTDGDGATRRVPLFDSSASSIHRFRLHTPKVPSRRNAVNDVPSSFSVT
jgi:hypothetical protein